MTMFRVKARRLDEHRFFEKTIESENEETLRNEFYSKNQQLVIVSVKLFIGNPTKRRSWDEIDEKAYRESIALGLYYREYREIRKSRTLKRQAKVARNKQARRRRVAAIFGRQPVKLLFSDVQYHGDNYEN